VRVRVGGRGGNNHVVQIASEDIAMGFAILHIILRDALVGNVNQ
jgi:hypothetical protein